jgi:hypothetical protein
MDETMDETMVAFAVGVKYIRYIVRYFYDPIFFSVMKDSCKMNGFCFNTDFNEGQMVA